MIKRRTRPQTTTTRGKSPEVEEEQPPVEPVVDGETEGETSEHLSIADLLELQKIRKARQGIDAAKLNKGAARRRKRTEEEEEEQKGGLKPGAQHDSEAQDEDEASHRARKAVRQNNFTGQTNALDVDKHMMAYIEENLKIRSQPKEETPVKPADPQDALYDIGERWKLDKQASKEGNVTNSSAMLTAIPEVDLGMDTRLRNIEDTERAKQLISENRSEKRKNAEDGEDGYSSGRYYRPNPRGKSDSEAMRDAKLEAMGLPVPEDRPQHNPNRSQVATDELVMERFKKRMRK